MRVALCLFPLPLCVRDLLHLVIVELPGRFFLPSVQIAIDQFDLFHRRYICNFERSELWPPPPKTPRVIFLLPVPRPTFCCSLSLVVHLWFHMWRFFDIICSSSLLSNHFSTPYTSIPHDILKSKLKEIINQCFFHRNDNRRFQYVVIGYKDTYFVRDHSDAPQKYLDADVIKMLEYLIDNIFCGVRRTDISANNWHTDGY